jgi:hypothetical protein
MTSGVQYSPLLFNKPEDTSDKPAFVATPCALTPPPIGGGVDDSHPTHSSDVCVWLMCVSGCFDHA